MGYRIGLQPCKPELKSLNLSAHKALLNRLSEARATAGLTQASLSERLGKPQSFVSKVESGERRLDVVEFVRWMQAIGVEPGPVLEAVSAELPPIKERSVLPLSTPDDASS